MYTAATTLLLLYIDEEQPSKRTTIAAAYGRIIHALTGLSTSWKIALSALISLDFLACSCLTGSEGSEEAKMLGLTAPAVKGAEARPQRPSQGPEELDFEAFLGDEFFFMPT